MYSVYIQYLCIVYSIYKNNPVIAVFQDTSSFITHMQIMCFNL